MSSSLGILNNVTRLMYFGAMAAKWKYREVVLKNVWKGNITSLEEDSPKARG